MEMLDTEPKVIPSTHIHNTHTQHTYTIHIHNTHTQHTYTTHIHIQNTHTLAAASDQV
jgi:hypothetical protein